MILNEAVPDRPVLRFPAGAVFLCVDMGITFENFQRKRAGANDRIRGTNDNIPVGFADANPAGTMSALCADMRFGEFAFAKFSSRDGMNLTGALISDKPCVSKSAANRPSKAPAELGPPGPRLSRRKPLLRASCGRRNAKVYAKSSACEVHFRPQLRRICQKEKQNRRKITPGS